jgi:hypothetical protein
MRRAELPSHDPRQVYSRYRQFLVAVLLVVGFFLGPLKLFGVSWVGYLSADILAVLVIVLMVVERIATRKPILAASPLSVPVLLLVAYCVFELLNPNAPFIRSVLGLRSWVLYLGFYFVGLYSMQSVRQVERLYFLLLTLGMLTAAYGVYQWRAGPQFFATWSDYYGQYARLAWVAQSGMVFRAFSTFVAAGTFGGNMALLMLLAFSIASSARSGLAWRLAAAGAFVIMGIGIAASGSRGPVALLIIAGVLAVMLVRDTRRKLGVVFKAVALAVPAVLAALFVIGPVISERFSTIFDPQAFFWKWFGPLMYGVRTALENPFGMGLGYTAGIPRFMNDPVIRQLPTTNVDSGYGSAAAELGLIGLGLFVFLAVSVGVQGVRVWSSLPSGRLRDLLLGPVLFAGTYPIVSVILQPQATLPSSIYFWLLIGMLMKAPALQRKLDADQLLRSQVHAGQ